MTDGKEPIHMDVTDFGSMGGNYGLTKREYFAAMAMQGILANSPDWNEKEHCLDWISKNSVIYADRLINALNNTNEKKA